MSAKALSELSGKELLYSHLTSTGLIDAPSPVRITSEADLDAVLADPSHWLSQEKVSFFSNSCLFLIITIICMYIKYIYSLVYLQRGVIKPDQLIKRRGKLGLVKCGSIDEIRQWIQEKSGSYFTVF